MTCRLLLSAVAAVNLFPSAAHAAGLSILAPSARETTTSQALLHLAAKVDAPTSGSTASIGGVPVSVYGTGVFVRDSIPLQMGQNAISIEYKQPTGAATSSTVTITRVAEPAPAAPPPTLPLFIDAKTAEPADNTALAPGEDVELTFNGAPGNTAEFRVAGSDWLPMHEQFDAATNQPSGTYRAAYALPYPGPAHDPDTSSPVLFRLSSSRAAEEPTSSRGRRGDRETTASQPIYAESPGRVATWPREGAPRMYRVKDDQTAQLSYGLSEVRLGGPFLAELTSGTLLRAVGRRGVNLRVELCPAMHAWVPAYQVEPASPGTGVPRLQFLDVNLSSTLEGHEMVIIPYTAPVPFAGRDVPAAGPGGYPRIEVDFYGAHLAATWLSHRLRGKLVNMVTLEQPQTDHLRLVAHLNTPNIWGYKAELTTGALRLIVRKPPEINEASPLTGLTVAVEAGHGGDNAGARGMAGSNEKDVTLAVSKELERQLVAAGAKVVQTRIGDESAGLTQRARRAMDANAHLFISVHCNSAGRTRGMLAVRGNSTLYKHPFNHELSADINQRILEYTGLAQFGVIGNFNYAPTRVLTWMPAVLVEQAFISNPEEEALMIDPAFQAKMARGIVDGITDYLRRAEERTGDSAPR